MCFHLFIRASTAKAAAVDTDDKHTTCTEETKEAAYLIKGITNYFFLSIGLLLLHF